MFQIKKASRKVSKMRIGIFGASGSGKTYSALLLAKGLVGCLSKVVVIDTENGSADLYSHLGEYSTMQLTAPFSPQRYVQAIKECESEGFELIVIDSISHEWDSPGGCLDIHAKLGGRFEHWSKITPMHKAFIDSIVQSKCHIITTGRCKTEHVFEGKNEHNPKGRVEKVGLKVITREGFDYELTTSFTLNQDHLAIADKDRTGLFNDVTPILITEEIGHKIAEWNSSGDTSKDLTDLKQSVILLVSEKIKEFNKDDVLAAIQITSSRDIMNEQKEDNLLDMVSILNSFKKESPES
jgi:hypothetical protein